MVSACGAPIVSAAEKVAVNVTAALVCPIANEPKFSFELNCALCPPAPAANAHTIPNPTNSQEDFIRAFSIGISSSGQTFPYFRFT
jgi:hypothetical protein